MVGGERVNSGRYRGGRQGEAGWGGREGGVREGGREGERSIEQYRT